MILDLVAAKSGSVPAFFDQPVKAKVAHVFWPLQNEMVVAVTNIITLHHRANLKLSLVFVPAAVVVAVYFFVQHVQKMTQTLLALCIGQLPLLPLFPKGQSDSVVGLVGVQLPVI